jgi:hypothetical protein
MHATVRRAVLGGIAVAAVLAVHVSSGAGSSHVLLPCLNKTGEKVVFKFKPGSCADFGPAGTNADSTSLAKLKWSSWGGSTAKARGVECGAHLPCAKIPAKVVASRPRKACGGRHVYTRLKVTTHFGTGTFPLSCRVPGINGP